MKLYGSGIGSPVCFSCLRILLLFLLVLGSPFSHAARTNHTEDLDNNDTNSDAGSDGEIGGDKTKNSCPAGCLVRGTASVPPAALKRIFELALLRRGGAVPYAFNPAVETSAKGESSDSDGYLGEENHQEEDKVYAETATVLFRRSTASKHSEEENEGTKNDEANRKI